MKINAAAQNLIVLLYRNHYRFSPLPYNFVDNLNIKCLLFVGVPTFTKHL